MGDLMQEVPVPEKAWGEISKMATQMQRMQNDINLYVSAILKTLNKDVTDKDIVEINYENKKLIIKAKE